MAFPKETVQKAEGALVLSPRETIVAGVRAHVGEASPRRMTFTVGIPAAAIGVLAALPATGSARMLAVAALAGCGGAGGAVIDARRNPHPDYPRAWELLPRVSLLLTTERLVAINERTTGDAGDTAYDLPLAELAEVRSHAYNVFFVVEKARTLTVTSRSGESQTFSFVDPLIRPGMEIVRALSERVG
jgi:hypothetical protein